MRKKMTTEAFIERARAVHGDKYDYSKTVYEYNHEKVCIICPIHNKEFFQTPGSHLSGTGCPICGRIVVNNSKKPSLQEFIEKASAIHNNYYTYEKSVYVNTHTKMWITCPKHGPFQQLAGNHLAGKGCNICAHDGLSRLFRLTKEDFITRSNILHNNKYDYSMVEYVNGDTKVAIICPKEGHGVFYQTADSHLHNHGCPKCSGGTLRDSEFFIHKAKEIHGSLYDYSMVDYVSSKNYVSIICAKHGIFLKSPSNHLKGQGCPYCKATKGERAIARYLTDHNIPYRTEVTFSGCVHVAPLRFDVVVYTNEELNEVKLVIEFDGKQHYEPENLYGGIDGLKLTQFRDLLKFNFCVKNAIPILMIPYWDINNINTILDKELQL